MKNIGLFLLGVWLVLSGLKAIIGLHFDYEHQVMGALATVAGAFIIIKQ